MLKRKIKKNFIIAFGIILIAQILFLFPKEDIKYNKIYSERPTLNDVFLELTGKELRDWCLPIILNTH